VFEKDRNLIDLTDELVKDGLVKIVETGSPMFGSRWSLTFICLTNGYCSEEDDNLAYVRTYLNLSDLGLGVTVGTVIQDPDFMVRYAEWLVKNKADLDKLFSTPELEPEVIVLSDTDAEILKGKKVYVDNKTISEVITDIDETIDLCNQQINIYNQIIDLKRGSRRSSEIKDDEASIQEVLVEIANNKRIKSYLNTFSDLKKNIQEIVK